MNRCRTGLALCLLVLGLILFQAGVSSAQEAAPVDPARRVAVWTNPILFVFGWYTGEVEIRLQENHTVGVSGSFLQFEEGDEGDFDYEDNEYRSISAFYRYYPDASFKGFFIGGQIGSVQVDQKTTDEFTGEITEESYNASTVGVLIGYGWLLGKTERVGVSIGIGANRLFGGDTDDDDRTTLPVIRLINVGIAF